MLDIIKSSHITNIIFSYIEEKRKLDIMKYSKKMQNKLNVNLFNYKLLSGKYIIYENNGKGKEYDFRGNIIFEGEYLNGKRWNGKGYFKLKDIIYELKNGNGLVNESFLENNQSPLEIWFNGEYLKGERHGKGKEYYFDYCDGKICIIFEGEYINGKRNGMGKEYDTDGNMIFEGEYLNGKRWNGKGYYVNNNIYELKNGKGFVKEYYNDELEFEGEYLNGEKNGKGKEYDYFGKLVFEGEYLNGQGNGKEYNGNGELIFEGEYLNFHKRNGKEYIKGKLEYEGEYLNGKKWSGKGYDENHNIISYVKDFYPQS